MARFSANHDEILIEEIQKYPPLYDYEDENYKNFVIKENAWKKVAFSVGKSVDDCKKRWRNIKDTYFRHTKKLKLGTGSSSGDKPIRWGLYNHLAFLANVRHERTSKNTLDEYHEDELLDSHQDTELTNEDSILDDSELDINSPTPETSNTRTSAKKSTQGQDSVTSDSPCSTPMLKTKARKYEKRVSKISSLSEFDERAQRRMDLLEAIHNNKQKEDDVDLFMKSIALTVKKFPPALINEAKLGILTLVGNLELKAAAYSPHPVSGAFWPHMQPWSASVQGTSLGHGQVTTSSVESNSHVSTYALPSAPQFYPTISPSITQPQNNTPNLNIASTSTAPRNSLISFFHSYNPQYSNSPHTTTFTPNVPESEANLQYEQLK